MKDIVGNRKRVSLRHKLQVVALSLRQNGIPWTALMGIYGATSGVADLAFRGMQSIRRKRGVPGMNSTDMNRLIWEKWDWSAAGEEWTPTDAWKESLIRKILVPAVPEGCAVVEIGPGAGRWTETILQRCGSYQGLDISRTCVEVCTAKFGKNPKAEFRATDGRSLPGVADASVDVIWSFDVFVHINTADVEAYLKEFARVLKPGGRAVLHHGSVGGERGGWRSDLTLEAMNRLAEARGLKVSSQIDGWQDGEATHDAGLYADVITTLVRP